MATSRIRGVSPLAKLRRRYERTETKCPECGYVDDGGNWTSRTNGRQIVYHHVCPSCNADREHTYDLGR